MKFKSQTISRIINENDEIIYEKECKDIKILNDYIAAVYKNNKYKILNLKNFNISEQEFNYVWFVDESSTYGYINQLGSKDIIKYGIINKYGEIIISPIYGSVDIIDDDFFTTNLNNVCFLYKNDKLILKASFISVINNIFIIKKLNDNHYIMDKNLVQKTKKEYDFIINVYDGNYLIEDNGKYGILNFKFDLILDIIYEKIQTFNQFMIASIKKDKFVFYKDGTLIGKNITNTDYIYNEIKKLERLRKIDNII